MLITGNTYPVKDQLRALGGKWKPAEKAWDVPADKAAEAQALVAGAPVGKRSSSTTTARSSNGRGRCYECDAWGPIGETCRECCEGQHI